MPAYAVVKVEDKTELKINRVFMKGGKVHVATVSGQWFQGDTFDSLVPYEEAVKNAGRQEQTIGG